MGKLQDHTEKFLKKELVLGTLNVRGLNTSKKQVQLNEEITLRKIDVLVATETWLQKEVEEKLETHQYEQSKHNAHQGIMLVVNRRKFKRNQVLLPQLNSEFLLIRKLYTRLGDRQLIVVGIYLSPGKLKMLTDQLLQVLLIL